ncbi:MAG: ankyrin repeat domain-containing protein [Spirochaetales bacterium]|nr:ankyrin repeat domain-containing protein [Spirochaetales bacterium]
MKNIIKFLSINLLLLSLLSCESFMVYRASESEVQITEAILRNDLAKVKSLLAEGVSANSRMPSSGSYILSAALANNNLEMAKLLIDAGALVNQKDRYGMPLLHVAKKAPMIKLMLESGADMYATYQDLTAYEVFARRLVTTDAEKKKAIDLIKAHVSPEILENAIKISEQTVWLTKQDIFDTIKVYKDFNYNVNRQRESDKASLLHVAAISENYDFISQVVSTTDANVNIKDGNNNSILGIITQSDNTNRSASEYDNLVAAMVRSGLKIDDLSPYETDENASPLMMASHKNFLNRCKTLIKFNADPKLVNENKKAAVNFSRHLRTMKFLVENGADPLNKDKWMQTTIFWQSDVAVIEYLLTLGVNVNDQDINGETALFSVRDTKVVDLLAKKGININQVNNKGQSVLEVDVLKIIEGMKYGYDYQDEYIPKMRTLIRLGISRIHISTARTRASGTSFDLSKTISVLR